jgi:hypothetical protein
MNMLSSLPIWTKKLIEVLIAELVVGLFLFVVRVSDVVISGLRWNRNRLSVEMNPIEFARENP